MPNHVINEVIFRNISILDQDEILPFLVKDSKVDFELLLPIPLNMWLGGVGAQHAKLAGNALDWCTLNWSTKWGPYGEQEILQTSDTLTLRFDTAWQPPFGWLTAVLNKTLLSFEHNWLSEGEFRGHSDKFIYGRPAAPFSNYEWKENPCDDDMQRHLHLLRWGVEEFEEDAVLGTKGDGE